jgi:excinuclease ABC subunit A
VRECNLKKYRRKILREKLVVITGLSGSGKSSLSFWHGYAEGQPLRKTFSYEQFLGGFGTSIMDKIDGLFARYCHRTKTTSKVPHVRLLGLLKGNLWFPSFVVCSSSWCLQLQLGEKMVSMSDSKSRNWLPRIFLQGKHQLFFLAPIIRARRKDIMQIIQQIINRFLKVRINGDIKTLPQRNETWPL